MLFLLFLLHWTIISNCMCVPFDNQQSEIQGTTLESNRPDTQQDTPSQQQKNDYDGNDIEQWIDQELDKVGECPLCTIL